MACTVKVTGDRAEVWAGTQDPLNSRGTAAKALEISASDVQYTNLALGGGFGRKLPGYHDFVDITARIAKVCHGAREIDLEPRDRHAARVLSAGGDGALCRCARPGGHTDCGVLLLRRRRRRRIDVHALRNRREEREGARRQASRPHRSMAIGAEFAARLLQGSVHRRDGARRKEGSVRVPSRPDERASAIQGGARKGRSHGEVGIAAAQG